MVCSDARVTTLNQFNVEILGQKLITAPMRPWLSRAGQACPAGTQVGYSVVCNNLGLTLRRVSASGFGCGSLDRCQFRHVQEWGIYMKMLITAGLLTFLASPVLAFQCPADMAAIDAALETAALSDEDLARVKELRATGETEHAAGNHQASVDALAEAKKLLGI